MTRRSMQLWKRAHKAARDIEGVEVRRSRHGIRVLTPRGSTVLSRNMRDQAAAKAAKDLDKLGV